MQPILKYSFFVMLCYLLNACSPTPNNDMALLYSYPKQGACSIDNPERNSTIDKSTEILIRGWAYDEPSQHIPDTLALYFVNTSTNKVTLAEVNRGQLRGDVAKAFGNPALEVSGFSGTFSGNKIEAGTYRLILLQTDRKIGVIACNGEPHTIMVH